MSKASICLLRIWQKMAQASELPKTSQPSIAKLDEILTSLKEQAIYMPWGFSYLLEFQALPKYPVYGR